MSDSENIEVTPEVTQPEPTTDPNPWLPLPDEIKAEVQAFNVKFGQMLYWWRVGANLPDIEVNPLTLTYRVK